MQKMICEFEQVKVETKGEQEDREKNTLPGKMRSVAYLQGTENVAPRLHPHPG
jgi:hypothetical protein